jgi:hypothetical protein
MNARRTAVILVGMAMLGAVPQALLGAEPENLREIELTDGTVLRAEIVSLHDGVFHLRSRALGEIEVPETRVKKIVIRSASPARPAPEVEPPPSSGAHAPAAGSEFVENLTRDPSFREKALSLQDDPAVQDILSDRATMDAIRNGDIDALVNDPKIQRLMQNPTVRELMNQQGR